jgi:hypothetical protein
LIFKYARIEVAPLEKMESQFSDYETGRHTRDGRRRAVGGGRKFDQPLALRTVAVLAYLRLHIPQLAIALMFGLTQCDISRDLRRLLPLITAILPCPVVWEMAAGRDAPEELVVPTSEELPGGRVLVDATGQRVSRQGQRHPQTVLFGQKESLYAENPGGGRQY